MRRKIQRRTISQRSELLYDWHEYGVNPDTREIMLSGPFDGGDTEGMEIDYLVSRTFIANLRFLEGLNGDPILVHSNICGGDWNYGMAIYDAVAASPAVVTMLSHAHARSMSSVLLQAADYRVLMPHADFLVHHGYGSVEGSTPNVVSEVRWWEFLQREMVAIYAGRAVKGSYARRKRWSLARVKEEIDQQLRQTPEWYMTARAAVGWGFADAILGDDGYEDVGVLLS